MDEITFNLQPGWNLISMPFTPQKEDGSRLKYSDLFELVNQGGGGCQSILPYDSEQNRWFPIFRNDAFTMMYNDELESGHGYALKCSGTSQITLKGILCKSQTFQFNAGAFYFFGPVGDRLYTAQGLSHELGLSKGSVIMPSDMEKQFRPDFPVNNFNLERGSGYFIKCASDKTWWYTEKEGQPIYEGSDGVYIWQSQDSQWHIHLDENAGLSNSDTCNNTPISGSITGDPYANDGAIFNAQGSSLNFHFHNLSPDNIHIGLWGVSPQYLDFSLYNSLSENNLVFIDLPTGGLSGSDFSIGQSFSASLYIDNPSNVYSIAFHLRFSCYP